MRINIVTNVNNGAGLQRDCCILKGLLEEIGHVVTPFQYTGDYTGPTVDANIFLETMNGSAIPFAAQNWLVPNPEWFTPSWLGVVHYKFTGIMCKTKDSLSIFQRLYGSNPGLKVVYTGWESLDLYDAAVPKEPTFLHVAGNSQTKNTEAVFNAWRSGGIPAKLVVLSKFYQHPGCSNVEVHFRVPDEQYKTLLNGSRFHICASQYEGFGHSMNEALASAGVVVTLDKPPMNEFVTDPRFLVASSTEKKMNYGTLYDARPDHLVQVCLKALELDTATLDEIGRQNREQFLQRREFFRSSIRNLWRM